jgi:hypothetical protein
MDTQNQVRLNRVVVDLLSVEHSLEQNKIGEQEALRKFNRAFDTLIDIRYDCPDEDVEGYVSKAWEHIERLTMK